VAKKGTICPIFEGDMPPKKYSPKIGANIGAITGILLIQLKTLLYHTTQSQGQAKLESYSSLMGWLIQLTNQIFELNRLTHSIQKYSCLKMNRAHALGDTNFRWFSTFFKSRMFLAPRVYKILIPRVPGVTPLQSNHSSIMCNARAISVHVSLLLMHDCTFASAA
jgi:hypothetical protein